jgi:hypothetical protein
MQRVPGHVSSVVTLDRLREDAGEEELVFGRSLLMGAPEILGEDRCLPSDNRCAQHAQEDHSRPTGARPIVDDGEADILYRVAPLTLGGSPPSAWSRGAFLSSVAAPWRGVAAERTPLRAAGGARPQSCPA